MAGVLNGLRILSFASPSQPSQPSRLLFLLFLLSAFSLLCILIRVSSSTQKLPRVDIICLRQLQDDIKPHTEVTYK